MSRANGRGAATTAAERAPVEITGGTTEPVVGPGVDGALPERSLPRLARHSITLGDGHEVGVAVCGEGVPLVVVHGFTAEGFLYAQTLWRLVDMGFKVIAVDTAGHGGTAGLPTGGADFSAYADLLGRVLDALGVRQAVLAGHSMGGRLVAELAATEPSRAIAVLLIDAIVGRTWDRLVWTSRVYPPVLAGVGAALLVDTMTTVPVLRDPRQALKMASLLTPTMAGHARRPWRLLGPAMSIMRSRGSGWMLDALREHDIPTFAVHGECDVAVPLSTGRDAARRAGGELVVVHRAMHSWILKDPEAMPGIMLDLMRGRLGTAVLRARLRAGLDGDAARSEIDASPAFYEPDALVVALTPHQPWRDEERYHRKPRYRWHIERD